MKRAHYFLCVILLLAAGLRVFHLGHAFWIDESFSAALATQEFSTITRLSAKDVHPPFYFLALRVWNLLGLEIFGGSPAAKHIQLIDYHLGERSAPAVFTVREGESEPSTLADGIHPAAWEKYALAPLWFLRLFNVVGALVSVGLVWLLATYLYPKNLHIALYGCLIFTCSGFAIFWDTVIRSYSFVAIFILGLYVLWPLMPNSFARRMLFCGALGSLLLLSYLTSYIALFFIPAYGVMSVLHGKSRGGWMWYIGTILLSVGLFLLVWGGRMEYQVGLGPPGSAPGLGALLVGCIHNVAVCISLFWRLVFSYEPWNVLNANSSPVLYYVAFFLFAIVIGSGLWRYRNGLSVSDGIVLSSMLAPFLIPAATDALRPGLLPLEARYFYPVLPFFALFLAAGLMEIETAIVKLMAKKHQRGNF
jgi:hypothetical protein